jgi:hypothetical protein
MSKGLLTLQTDLKSLRYGNDKPYITKDINNGPSSNQADMRGTKRVDDLSRIAQMLVDRPGLQHLGNEALLRQVGVEDRIRKSRKSGKTVAGAILKEVGGTLLNTVKIVGSTLIQVPVNGTGTHFLRGFRTDTYLQPLNGNTRSGFAQFFGAGGVEGAPSAIRGEEVVGTKGTDFVEGVIPTGKIINPNTGKGSKFQYDAPVRKDGDGDTNWNEKANNYVAEWATRQDTNRSYAASGKAIPVGKVETKPVTGVNADTGEVTTLPGFDVPFQQAPKGETTLASGSLGISNRDVKGEVTQLDQPVIKPFKEEDQVKKAKDSTEQNIINAQSGSVITLQGKQYETTAQRFQLGRSNQLTEADEPEILSDNGNDGSQKYSLDNTYTGNTSQNSINNALRGKKISTNKGEKYDEAYLRNTSEFKTDGTQQALVEDLQDEQGNVIRQGGTVGKSSIPKLTSLQALRAQINTGSATIIGDDYDNINTGIQDFRQGSKTSYSYDYNTKDVHKEQRVNLGNQGRKKSDKAKVNYMITDDLAVDKINAADISTSGRLDGTEGGRDLAKFYFEIITPSSNTFLHFRAFIDSIDDGYTAEWNSHRYVGRAENFYTYGGFDRDISVSFKIAAATRKEMKPLYKKMVYLASSTAPTYGTSGLMRGTLARLTIGSYFSQIPGVITSVKFTLDNEAPWELAMGNPDGGAGSNKDDDVQELPMVLNCSVSFKPIHDFAPQTGLFHYFTNPEPVNGGQPFF